ncbi:hypothetical protein AAGY40_14095, partial [Staphylococcus aureus]
YYFKHKVRHLFFNFATEPFKRYAYRNNRYGFKRDFKLYECDDCSATQTQTATQIQTATQTQIVIQIQTATQTVFQIQTVTQTRIVNQTQTATQIQTATQTQIV